MMTTHPHPEIEQDLRRLAVAFSAQNIDLASLASGLTDLAARARAELEPDGHDGAPREHHGALDPGRRRLAPWLKDKLTR